MTKHITPHPHNPFVGDPPQLSLNLNTIDDGTDEMVSVIIIHNNQPNFLNITLQSAFAMTSSNVEYIVVDNNSNKESHEFLDEIEGDGLKIIRNEKNLYWSAAANIGAKAANKNSKYFIFLHHDVVILNPSWVDLLLTVSKSNQSGVVGVNTGSYQIENQRVEFLEEWCLLVTREAFEDIGGFNEKLPVIGSAFLMTLAAQNKGWKPNSMKNNGVIHHYGIFGFDLSDYERLTEQAYGELPKQIQQTQQLSRNI